MIRGLGTLVLAICFVIGCAVRLWQWSQGPGQTKRGHARTGDERVRIAVRRPAVDVPVDGVSAKPRDDDPLFPWGDS